jgi:PAS domain S-box-containing protein
MSEMTKSVGDRGTSVEEIDRLRAQVTSLAEQLAELDSAYRAAPIGLAMLDRQFRFVRVNERLAEFNGVPASEHIGRTVHEVAPDVADAAETVFQQVLRTAKPVRGMELVAETRAEPGVKRTWLEHWHPFFGTSQEVIGVCVAVEDVTDRKKIEEELRRADRQKDEFLAMLGHELRNPLAPLYTASELLARYLSGDSRVQGPLGIIRRQLGHLNRLVDDLLDASRIAQGKIELQREPLEIHGVVDEAVEAVQPIVHDRRHRLVIGRAGEELYVMGDRARLVQSILNVLHNAAKYTDPNGEIRLDVLGEGDRVAIKIADNGIGIRPEVLPDIFEMFVQSERTLDRSQGGLGIGLAVVKRLIQMHNGTVTASSSGAAHGSTFTITLPRIPTPQQARGGEEPILKIPTRRILIVDDNIDLADSLSTYLKLEGHYVETCYNGADALEAASRLNPDVIFVDIGLPEMDGYELASRLRAMPQMQHQVRLIALTGYGTLGDKERALAAGFDLHLVKPVQFSVIEALLTGT